MDNQKENRGRNEKPHLSIVIPVFNEERRLGSLDKVLAFFRQFSFPWELIIVDDGSVDSTLAILDLWKKWEEVRILTYQPNRGKGYAIKQGMLQARGKYRLFMDIDLSTPLEEFYLFQPFLGQYDVLIGTRKRGRGQIIKPQPWLRESLGRGFTWLTRTILRVEVSDFTCGFKIFSDSAAQFIFPRLRIERWGFDAEVLYLAKKFGFSVHEIGVRWRNDPLTKVNLKKDIWRSFKDLIQIRINDWRGLYEYEKI